MNLLKNSLALAQKDLKILFKDRGQLAVIFMLPLLLALILGLPYAAMKDPVTTTGETKLTLKAYLVNEDQGSLGAQITEVLEDIQTLRISRLQTQSQADKKVAEGEAAAAILIPPDFSARIESNQPVQIQLIKDPTQQGEAQAVAGILNEVLAELSARAEIEYGIRAVYAKTGVLEGSAPEIIRAAQAQTMGAIWTAVQEFQQNPVIAVQLESLEGKQVVLPISGIIFGCRTPMFATMFAFFMVGTMAESILKEKETGSFRRLMAAPMHRVTVISGKMVAFIGVVFLQMLFLFGICSTFFDMPLGESPLALLALTLALALAATSFGMLIGSLSRTSKQAGNLGVVLGFALYIASGTINFADLSIHAGTVEVGQIPEGFWSYLAQLTPHFHAVDGYFQLMIKGAGLADIGPNILALLGFGVVFFAVSMWRFKFD